MAQSSVSNAFNATGIPGEFSRTTGQDAKGAILDSAVEANNVVGRVVFSNDGDDYTVSVGGDGNISGILATPKISYRNGLGAQAYLPNASQCEVAKAGYMFVTLPAAADDGDFVYYLPTTGVLEAKAPATPPTASYVRLPGGKVVGNTAAAGVAEIYFDVRSGSTETATA